MAMIPVEHVYGFHWGPDVLVIPEFCFGVRILDAEIRLSREDTEFRWVSYQSAMHLLHWDSNRTALWELDLRLQRELNAAPHAFRSHHQRRHSKIGSTPKTVTGQKGPRPTARLSTGEARPHGRGLQTCAIATQS